MKTTKKTARKSSATAPERPKGNMSKAEKLPLIMAARKAFDIQKDFGNVDAGETFDAWRRRECLAVVEKPGFTACDHRDYLPLLSHFQTLAGDDAGAFKSSMRTGKPTDNAAPGDTHEDRRQLAHSIALVLNDHLHIANTSVDGLVAELADEYSKAFPGVEFRGPSFKWLEKIVSRKDAIQKHGQPISVGYLVYLVRQKTKRPDLTLGSDWQASLAERCTVKQLQQIHFTLRNRINAVEGAGATEDRNRKQRSPRSKQIRARKDEERRW